ncbi:MAG: oxidoreductase [Planctomycetes bacterium]|nr:oxidoreductase [Planctomycetota bacterium]
MLELSTEMRERLLTACGRLARPDYKEKSAYNKARRRKRTAERKQADEAVLERTRIRSQRIALVYPTPLPDGSGDVDAGGVPATPPSPGSVRLARNCYICKADYHEVHGFYDAMCGKCADLNWEKRNQTADLGGRVALLTGGRVKIGYQAGVKLLRAGAHLIVTTRFPRDAAVRYAGEPDFEEWCDRLAIYGLDLRHTPSVEALCSHLHKKYQRLDFLVNNACQTVRRPPGFYAHLMEAEAHLLATLPNTARGVVADYEALRQRGELLDAAAHGPSTSQPSLAGASGSDRVGIDRAAALSQLALVDGDADMSEVLFPTGRLDADLQQVDLRDRNSWRLALAEVPTVELLEVHLVNAVAPFVFNARLKPLMLRANDRDKHVVNVSAMEGQFYRAFKTDKHPHTNMAKASLNMMTRTSAADYLNDGIHMNSVDTGWITDEDPAHLTELKRQEHGFHTPLDHVDAAARILDPIFHGINTGDHAWGQFFKDYKPTRW